MGKKTQVYEYHRKHGNIVDYAGFDLPVWFEGILPECRAVRTHAGIFDVSHMGRVLVEGPDAGAFLDHLTTNDVSALAVGRGQYSLLCKQNGGIIDDITLFRIGGTKFLVVYNAGNRGKDWNWLQAHRARRNVTLSDVSDKVAMFAVQGPRAGGLLRDMSGARLEEVEKYGTADVIVNNVSCLITHSGYTGEDGFEIYVWNTSVQDPAKAMSVWETLLANGRESGLRPAGLGARDVLRLEAGMCLYGNDIDENTFPIEARLSWVIRTEKDSFPGKDVILKMKQAGPSRVRVGFRIREKGIPRQGQDIRSNEETVGKVTSGTFSPTLDVGIGMGFVRPAYSRPGERVSIRIRDHDVAAEVVRLPFYQRRSQDRVVVFGEEMGLKDFRSKQRH
jgi:aminomethyltransferase